MGPEQEKGEVSMNPKQHIHHKEIKAWADGKVIQLYARTVERWDDDPAPDWHPDKIYRIKPPEPEWMPKEGDWILAWNEEGKSLVQFKSFLKRNRWPWRCKGDNYQDAKPFPLQVERDRYRAALKHTIGNESNSDLIRTIVKKALEDL